jgi:hypothetical protein
MNNLQRAKLDTCNRVKDFNARNANSLNTIEEYQFEQDAFNNALAIINNATQVQSRTQGITPEVTNNAKEAMSKIILKYALRGLVKAKQSGNTTLANHLDHPLGYFTRTTKTQAVQRAKEIKEQLENNLSILTNITTDNITEIENAINKYDSIKDQPVIQIQQRVATGTNPLPNAYSVAFKAIDNMFDLVNSYFIDTNPVLVDELALAKQIITTGVHHTGVTGTVFKEGLPLKGITISIAGTNKTAVTDMEGNFIITKIKTGDYTIEAKDKSGETQSKNIHINKANFETVDFFL